jgi:glycosyltransferase involved in cell wall biosynthesis
MGKPFFSVIVPAHNSERYIWKCLDSVAAQTFRDFELIVVCDDCTDRTVCTARAYADRVIETNYGMDGMARNAGIEAAAGRWILFLDDDDWWIHEHVLSEIHKVAYRMGAAIDMITFDFIWKGIGYISTRADRMNIAVWSKAFRRAFIGGTRFPGIAFTSDKPFMDAICAKRPRVYALNELMYYYNFMREGSQTEQHRRGGES